MDKKVVAVAETLNGRCLAGEEGKTTTTAMLFCITALTAYLKVGRFYFEGKVPQLSQFIALAVLLVLAVFTIGCVLHMIIIGERSNRELRRDVIKQVKELTLFLNRSHIRIETLEHQIGAIRYSIRPHTYESLRQVRRIVNALARRVNEVNELLAARSGCSLIDAHELLTQPLVIGEDALESLIGGDPIPALDPREWFGTIESICFSVEAEIRHFRLAA